jgi:type IX secretion system PorP/SprF family membrane protein
MIYPDMQIFKKLLIVLFVSFSFYVSNGQQTPLNPISYWIFTPYIYNPAIIGSKDFLSVNLNSAFQGKSNAQIISLNTRFSKTRSGYFTSPDILEFKNTGIGGSVFHDLNGRSENFGISMGGSYQIPLNTRELSFFSLGASVKGIYNILDTASFEQSLPSKKTFYSNLDLGIYYFGIKFYAGISTTNVFGNPEKHDVTGIIKIPVARQYFFSAGYKMLINKSMNIVLEPSLLFNAYDSTFKRIFKNINPILKLYVENFCVGTYFNSDGKTSFFTQFRYPRFYVGAFFELPKKTPYYRRSPIVQLTMGINIQVDKSRLSNHNQW